MQKNDNDITSSLSEEQYNELKSLVEVDEMKDTMTMDDYIKATEKWRKKLYFTIELHFYRYSSHHQKSTFVCLQSF